jgi:predicted nucleic acid-binding protein
VGSRSGSVGTHPAGRGRSPSRLAGTRVGAILLDTTVLIDVLRGRGAVGRLRGLRASGDTPFVCALNVEEIVRGLRPDEEAPAQKLVEGLRVASLGDVEGWRAGEWRRDFAARGVTLAQADCLVASAAVSIGGRLATGNPKDFPMPELTVEYWPAGE